MPEQVEKRVKYRVVGDLDGGRRTLTILTGRSLAECRERVEAGIDRDYENVRVQESRCTPWEDVADV